MKNIPNFTCEYGAAALVLREIPYSGIGYCMVLYAEKGMQAELLAECRRFCVMAGADRVYSRDLGVGKGIRILRMSRLREGLPETDASLWPLLPENREEYRRIYNEAMRGIPAARSLSAKDMEALEGAYFVHRDGILLGIGQVEGGELRAIVSCVHGAGMDVALALLSVCQEEWLTLCVADCNRKALRLYDRLGFTATGVAETWYEL